MKLKWEKSETIRIITDKGTRLVSGSITTPALFAICRGRLSRSGWPCEKFTLTHVSTGMRICGGEKEKLQAVVEQLLDLGVETWRFSKPNKTTLKNLTPVVYKILKTAGVHGLKDNLEGQL